MAAVDEPFLIYTNLLKMLEYRGQTLVGPKMGAKEFGQVIGFQEYIIVTASTAGNTAPTERYYLISPGSKYSTKSPEFIKLIAAIKDIAAVKTLSFIMEDTPSNSIMGKLKEFCAERPTIFVEFIEHFKLYAELPKHVLVARHEIASQEEIDLYCKTHCKNVSEFPKIHVRDTQAIWIGARPGQVCKVYRVSENTGITIVYRPVIGSFIV